MLSKRTRFALGFSIFIIAVLAVGVLSAGAAGGKWSEQWESIDNDGSYQVLTLYVGPDGSVFLALKDDGATACGLDDNGNPMYAAKAQGPGEKNGGTISVTFEVWCLTRPPTYWGQAEVVFNYQPATDTLVDNFGVVWTRR